ncbi:MAG TPA: hypothetical protein EYP61_10290 [Candidatus Latescibacteria bacterium]|nr:hypothetical protein [Candidatus Latescibacterota bacterium]
MEGDIFVYGAQYYRTPNPPRGERRRDIEQMARLGFNVVKLQAHWNWINYEPDVFDFEEIEEMMDWAARNSLGVILMTSLENAPWWLAQEHPEARYMTADGRVLDLQAVGGTPAGGWPGLCFDNEPVRKRAEDFIVRLVERFRGHPALSYWHAWEEPHMEPTSNMKAEGHICNYLLCCCEASLGKFRRWLRERYGDLRGLNRAWHTRYSDWEQIRPPQNYGCYSLLMDWQRFQQENLAEIMAWRAGTIRKVDPEHPVISHLGANSVTSNDVHSPYMDDWKTARYVDIWGASVFPAWCGEEFMSVQLTAAASAAKGKPYWCGELQADGGCSSESIFIATRPSAERFAAWNWIALGHGVRGIVLWQYRPEMLGPESPGFGLCALDGSPTLRAEVASKFCKLVNSTPALKLGGLPQPKVGIVHSKDCNNLMRCATPDGEPLFSSLMGIYRTLFRANIPFRFVHIEEDSLEGMLKIKVLFFPLPLCLGPEQAGRIREYVKQGGTLVCEAQVAQYDLHGFASEWVPGMGLEELFGCRRTEESTCRIESEKIETEMGEMEGMWIKEAYEPTSGEPIGFYRDGKVAAVRNKYGEGQAMLFGSLVFCSESNAPALRSLIPEECLGPVRTEPEAFARMLRAGSEAALIVVNLEDRPKEVKVSLEGLSLPERVEDIWNGREWEVEEGTVRLSLGPWGSAVIKI